MLFAFDDCFFFLNIMLYTIFVKNINFSFVQGRLHFVRFWILHPMPDDLTIVKTSSLVFFLIVKERAYMLRDVYLAPLQNYYVNRGSPI